MRILFMGTPDFSVPTLKALIDSEHQVIGVVTQPDKPKGRGKEMQFTPVKETALEYQIPVYQPVKVREEDFMEEMRKLEPDVGVVIAFGQILPKAFLELPKYGCINIHASLLPKYRGAAPVQWAVIEGEEKSGLTTMLMDVGIDTGDMLLQKEILLDKKETGGSLFDKLSRMGGELIMDTLKLAEEGSLTPIKQDDSQATYVKMLDKSFGKIDFTRPAVEIERLIRGLNPWPSAFTSLDGKTLKIWDAEVNLNQKSIKSQDADMNRGTKSGTPGEIIEVTKDAIVIQTGMGALIVKELQLEGKKRMSVDAFLRGYTVEQGTVLS